jgi:lysophospholipase L1-like esterase
VKLAVALLPESQHIGRDKYTRLLPTLEADGIPILDTYPAFIAKGVTTGFFVPRDGHPNEAGAQLIADALVDLLKKRGLLVPSRGG